MTELRDKEASQGECGVSDDVRRRFAGTAVGFCRIHTTEDLDGRVTLDVVLLTQIRLRCAVDLDQRDVFFLELGGSCLILGSKGFAVTAPRREKFRKHKRMLFYEVLERVLSQRDNVRFGVRSERGARKAGARKAESEPLKLLHGECNGKQRYKKPKDEEIDKGGVSTVRLAVADESSVNGAHGLGRLAPGPGIRQKIGLNVAGGG